ncbi:hypothetical protein B0E43_19420 [Algoriphagus sp. A40]|nr:hypothetical protein B0E43_19420 [Algoriphagus sp. A40]
MEKAEEIKIRIRDEFGIKYALKSPPHITLKMPFNFSEAKEGKLIGLLGEQLKDQASFSVKISGVGTFGNRVIFLRIEESAKLRQLQEKLKLFCKKELHLIDELSDRNFHPHLTVAFKDLKSSHFPEVLARVRQMAFEAEFSTADLVLLKRQEGKWIVHRKVTFGG